MCIRDSSWIVEKRHLGIVLNNLLLCSSDGILWAPKFKLAVTEIGNFVICELIYNFATKNQSEKWLVDEVRKVKCQPKPRSIWGWISEKMVSVRWSTSVQFLFIKTASFFCQRGSKKLESWMCWGENRPPLFCWWISRISNCSIAFDMEFWFFFLFQLTWAIDLVIEKCYSEW